ncbi:MAG: hypothetical protein AAGI54_14240, partial [Planctomycetota bacterium]
MARSIARPARAPLPADRALLAAAAALLAAAALACLGCAAERTPVSAVPPSFSHVEEGRTLGPPSPARASVADRFLRPTVDRPV